MHRAVLLSTLLLSGAACTTRISADDAPPSTHGTPAVTAPAVTEDPAVQCVWTDPGRNPISVHRAVNCPDGTTVTVRGILTQDGDRTLLCDSATIDDNCLTIVDTSPSPLPALTSDQTVFTGTVSGHRLYAAARP